MKKVPLPAPPLSLFHPWLLWALKLFHFLYKSMEIQVLYSFQILFFHSFILFKKNPQLFHRLVTTLFNMGLPTSIRFDHFIWRACTHHEVYAMIIIFGLRLNELFFFSFFLHH